METVVLLFTDVEGSTRAWASSPDMVRSLEYHDLILRDAFTRNGGTEFKHTGDGLCATFPSVSDAVDAAADLQRMLAEAEWADGPALRVRVAVHAGPAHRRGDDWFGLSLSRCARVLGMAHGGQVLLTSTAAAMLRDGPPGDIDLVDLGDVSLRDFSDAEHVFQLVAPGLPRDFPALRIASSAGNLPAALSSLVGRSAEITRVRAMLTDARLVTLTGPGGIGKTRLALAAAGALSADLSGGAWMVELAAVQRDEDVDALLAATLGFLPRPGVPTRSLITEGIGDREIAVVLDNCEHVLEHVAALTNDLRRHCPQLHVLATSREPLGVEGEHVLGVRSLDVTSDAVDLFVERAAAADAAFVAEPRALIEFICRRLDGIPLAIELAASMVRLLPLSEIATGLGDQLDVVTAGRRGRIERHATLRAALDWSWGMLEEPERLAFARMSIFAGPFDREAAEAVTGVAASAPGILFGLALKSMVTVDPGSVAPFRLLEPLRQYASEQLRARGEVDDTARRHAEYYAALSSELSHQLVSVDEVHAARRLDAARDNLRGAFAYASSRQEADLSLRIVVPLTEYANSRVWAEAWSWSDAALQMPHSPSHPLYVGALLLSSAGAAQLRDHERSLALAESALALVPRGAAEWRDAQRCRATALLFLRRVDEAVEAGAASVGDSSGHETAGDLSRRSLLILIRNVAGHPDEASALQLLEDARSSSPSALATALHVAGVVATDRSIALERQRAAVDVARATGNRLIEGFAQAALAAMEAEGDPAGSVRHYGEVLANFLRVGNRTHVREFARGVLAPLAGCSCWQAVAVVDGATRSSAMIASIHQGPVDHAIATARSALGDDYYAAAARGATMTDDELVTFMNAVAAGLPGHTP